MALNELRKSLATAQGLREGFRRQAKTLTAETGRLAAEVELLDLVTSLFRVLIDREVASSVAAVEQLQIEGLSRVFDDQKLSVKSSVDVSRGKVSVTLSTLQTLADDTVIEGVSNEAFGGAVTTVQSVILRITVLFRRGLRPVLFLDEALPAFDESYVYNMGVFLRGLCRRMGLDVLLVTHVPALADSAHRAYRISNTGGVASFRLLTGSSS